MFLGTHSPRLDEKGRIILPAKFREELASGLVVFGGTKIWRRLDLNVMIVIVGSPAAIPRTTGVGR